MTSTQHIHLAWSSDAGPSAWADPRAPASLDWSTPDMYVEMTRVLEAAGFDFVLFEDGPAIPVALGGTFDAYIEHGVALPRLDAAVLAPMLAVRTRSIGIVPTMTTTYYPPYLLARLLATLDHVTEGRIGWSVTTSHSAEAAETFGLPSFGLPALPASDAVEDLLDEYLGIVTDLFGGWDRDAVLQDVATGVFADPAKVRPLDHDGAYFRVRGPLNVVPGPQERPPIVSSDVSPAGLARAGRYADVLVAPLTTVDEMRATRAALHAQATAAGRPAGDVKILFAASALLGRTADALDAVVRSVPTDRAIAAGLARLSAYAGVDLTAVPLDAALPSEVLTALAGQGLAPRLPADASLTVRAAAELVGTPAGATLQGEASAIADQLEETFDAVDGDGFLIRGSWVPEEVNAIANQVAAELRRRGRIADVAPGTTLRRRLLGAATTVPVGP